MTPDPPEPGDADPGAPTPGATAPVGLSGGVAKASVRARLVDLLPDLGRGQRAVAEVIVADPGAVAELTIDELAGRAGTSLSAVTRLCRTLDLSGYAKLRLELAAESGQLASGSYAALDDSAWSQIGSGAISPHDSVAAIIDHLRRVDVAAIEETAAVLDPEVVDAVAAAVVGARRVGVVAVSGSAAMGRDFALKLARIGLEVPVWSDVHDALTSCSLLSESDVVIGVTHSGGTREVVEPLREANDRGATTVVVTNHRRSTAARLSRFVLLTAASETPYRAGGPAARHAQLLVLDALYLRVAQLGFPRAEAALAASDRAVRRVHAPRSREDRGRGGSPP